MAYRSAPRESTTWRTSGSRGTTTDDDGGGSSSAAFVIPQQQQYGGGEDYYYNQRRMSTSNNANRRYSVGEYYEVDRSEVVPKRVPSSSANNNNNNAVSWSSSQARPSTAPYHQQQQHTNLNNFKAFDDYFDGKPSSSSAAAAGSVATIRGSQQQQRTAMSSTNPSSAYNRNAANALSMAATATTATGGGYNNNNDAVTSSATYSQPSTAHIDGRYQQQGQGQQYPSSYSPSPEPTAVSMAHYNNHPAPMTTTQTTIDYIERPVVGIQHATTSNSASGDNSGAAVPSNSIMNHQPNHSPTRNDGNASNTVNWGGERVRQGGVRSSPTRREGRAPNVTFGAEGEDDVVAAQQQQHNHHHHNPHFPTNLTIDVPQSPQTIAAREQQAVKQQNSNAQPPSQQQHPYYYDASSAPQYHDKVLAKAGDEYNVQEARRRQQEQQEKEREEKAMTSRRAANIADNDSDALFNSPLPQSARSGGGGSSPRLFNGQWGGSPFSNNGDGGDSDYDNAYNGTDAVTEEVGRGRGEDGDLSDNQLIPTLTDRVQMESDGSLPTEELHQCLVLLWVPSGLKKSRKLNMHFVPTKGGKWRIRKLLLRITNTVSMVSEVDEETGAHLPPSARITKTGEISIRKFDDKQTLRFQEKVHHLTQVASFSVPPQFPVPLLSVDDHDADLGPQPNLNDESSSDDDDAHTTATAGRNTDDGVLSQPSFNVFNANPNAPYSLPTNRSLASASGSAGGGKRPKLRDRRSVVLPKSSGGTIEIEQQLRGAKNERAQVRKIRNDRRRIRYTCGDVGMRIISASGDVYPIAMPSSVEVETWLASLREMIRQHEHEAAFEDGAGHYNHQHVGGASAGLDDAAKKAAANPYMTGSRAHANTNTAAAGGSGGATAGPMLASQNPMLSDKERIIAKTAELENGRPDASAFVQAFLARDIRRRSAKGGVIKSNVTIDEPPNGGEVQLMKTDGKSTTNWRFWATKPGEAGKMTLFKLGKSNMSKPVFALREKLGAVSMHQIDADDCDIYVEFPWASTVIALISRSKQQSLYFECQSLDNRIAWENWLRLMGATKILSLEEQAALMDDTKSTKSGWRGFDPEDGSYSDSQSIQTGTLRPDSFAAVGRFQQAPNGRSMRRRSLSNAHMMYEDEDYYDRDEDEAYGEGGANSRRNRPDTAEMWREAEDEVRDGDDIYMKDPRKGLFNAEEIAAFRKRHASSMYSPTSPHRRAHSPMDGSSPWLGGKPYNGFSTPLSAAALRAWDQSGGRMSRRRSITFADEDGDDDRIRGMGRGGASDGDEHTDRADGRTPSAGRSEDLDAAERTADDENNERKRGGSIVPPGEEVSAAALLRVGGGGANAVEEAYLTNLQKEEHQLRKLLEDEVDASEDALLEALREINGEHKAVVERQKAVRRLEVLQLDEAEERAHVTGVEIKARRQLVRMGRMLSSPPRDDDDDGNGKAAPLTQEEIDAQLVADANKWREHIAGLQSHQSPMRRGVGGAGGGKSAGSPTTRRVLKDTLGVLESIIVDETAQSIGAKAAREAFGLRRDGDGDHYGDDEGHEGDEKYDEHDDDRDYDSGDADDSILDGRGATPPRGSRSNKSGRALMAPQLLATPSRNPQGTAGTNPRDAEYMKRMRLKLHDTNLNNPPPTAAEEPYAYSTAVADASSLHALPSATLPPHVVGQPKGGAYVAADSTVAVSVAANEAKKKEEIRKIIQLHAALRERELAGADVSGLVPKAPNNHLHAAIITSNDASPAITAAERRQLALEEKLIFQENQRTFQTDRISSSLADLIASADTIGQRSDATRGTYALGPIKPIDKEQVALLRLRMHQNMRQQQQNGNGAAATSDDNASEAESMADTLLNVDRSRAGGSGKAADMSSATATARGRPAQTTYGRGGGHQQSLSLADEILGDEGTYGSSNTSSPIDATAGRMGLNHTHHHHHHHDAVALRRTSNAIAVDTDADTNEQLNRTNLASHALHPSAVNFDTAYGRSAQLIHPVVDVDPFAAGAPSAGGDQPSLEEQLAAHKAQLKKVPQSRLMEQSRVATSTMLQCPRRHVGDLPPEEVIAAAAHNDDDVNQSRHEKRAAVVAAGQMSRVPITYYEDGILHQVSPSSPMGKQLQRELDATRIGNNRRLSDADAILDGVPHTWLTFSPERIRLGGGGNTDGRSAVAAKPTSAQQQPPKPSSAANASTHTSVKAEGLGDSMMDNAQNFSFGFTGFGGGGDNSNKPTTATPSSLAPSAPSANDANASTCTHALRIPMMSVDTDDRMTDYLANVQRRTRQMQPHIEAVTAATSATPSASYARGTTVCAICGEDKRSVGVCSTTGRKHVLIGTTASASGAPAGLLDRQRQGLNSTSNAAAEAVGFVGLPPLGLDGHGFGTGENRKNTANVAGTVPASSSAYPSSSHYSGGNNGFYPYSGANAEEGIPLRSSLQQQLPISNGRGAISNGAGEEGSSSFLSRGGDASYSAFIGGGAGQQPSVIDYSTTAPSTILYDSPGRAQRVERRRQLI